MDEHEAPSPEPGSKTTLEYGPVKIGLSRGMKGEYGFTAEVRAMTVGEATKQLEAADRWFKERYTSTYRPSVVAR